MPGGPKLKARRSFRSLPGKGARCPPPPLLEFGLLRKFAGRSGGSYRRRREPLATVLLVSAVGPQSSERLCALRLNPGHAQACPLVHQGIPDANNPAPTQSVKVQRSSAGSASLPALRRLHPLGPTPPASEALASAWTTRRRFPSQQLSQNPPNSSMSSIKRDVKKKVLPRPEARCFLEIQPTGIRLR